jgi:hypothetical protein
MEIEFPLYAMQRTDNGRWLIRAPADDPRLPAVAVVAALDEPVWRPRIRLLGLVPRLEGDELARLPEWYLD